MLRDWARLSRALSLSKCNGAGARKTKKVVHQPGRGYKGDELSVGFGCIRFGEKQKVGYDILNQY